MNRFFSKQAYRVTALEIRKRLAIAACAGILTSSLAFAGPPDNPGNSGVLNFVVDTIDDDFANCDVSFDAEEGLIATSCTYDGFVGIVEACQPPENSATFQLQIRLQPKDVVGLVTRSHDAFMNVYDWDGDLLQFANPEDTCDYLTNKTHMLLATGRGHDTGTDNNFTVEPGRGNAFTRHYSGRLLVANNAGGTTNLQMRWKGLIKPNGDESITTHIKLTPDPRY